MKITYEDYNSKITLEEPVTDIYEVADVLKRMLISAGFHPNSINEVIRLED